MMEYMEKTAKVEKTEQYNISRIGKPATKQEEEELNG
jgi:hypothetical protein